MVMANAINLPVFNHYNDDMAAVTFTRVYRPLNPLLHYSL